MLDLVSFCWFLLKLLPEMAGAIQVMSNLRVEPLGWFLFLDLIKLDFGCRQRYIHNSVVERLPK